jgi:hypothetical protein
LRKHNTAQAAPLPPKAHHKGFSNKVSVIANGQAVVAGTQTLRAYPRSDLDAVSLFRVDSGIPSTLV